MLDVCLLGTGGMMPLPYRWLTSLMLRYNGSSLLIDCGEGTQIAIREKGWSFKPIDIICITHFHGDHISGLPGILLAMGNSDRTDPLYMIGPKGLEKVVNALRIIAPELPFEIRFIEIAQPYEEIRMNGYVIRAFKVNHKITCYGYTVEIERAGMFDVAKAESAGIPKMFWSKLQKGETIQYEDRTLTPDMVLGEPRKGIKLTYTTDTRPTESIITNAQNADLLICEGMYGEKGDVNNAVKYKHMTFEEAAKLAKAARVKTLWLTHYSPALGKPDIFMDDVRKIFPNAYPGKDKMSVELSFED
ncbi:MAG: ribonuclease Z [Clostridiales bacterium]|nr:ribonuclease Z [Clostridiales bacterium]MDY3747793.1 ribonuclease Z [Lachnospiraceae bacterium]